MTLDLSNKRVTKGKRKTKVGTENVRPNKRSKDDASVSQNYRQALDVNETIDGASSIPKSSTTKKLRSVGKHFVRTTQEAGTGFEIPVDRGARAGIEAQEQLIDGSVSMVDTMDTEAPQSTSSFVVNTLAASVRESNGRANQTFPKLKKHIGQESSSDNQASEAEGLQYLHWIRIRLPNVRIHRENPRELVSLDTGADNSVVFESKLVKLGLQSMIYYREQGEDLGTYSGLGRGTIQVVGRIDLKFTFSGGNQEYEAAVDVLKDYPDTTKVHNFNILIGRPTLNKYNLVMPDRNQMPEVFYIKKQAEKDE